MAKKKFLIQEETAPSIREADLTGVLENNITEYGLSVLEDRMIPSVRDGLKPAQRRLLKAMYDMKCWNSSPTVKSARVLGDTMGKYHPHSEAYKPLQTLVNQTYSLVQGQGNWGSVDDEAAAPRYTECKFSKLGQKCMESYCVAEEVPNFSGEYMEPIDIPMDFPCFFVNGGDGVGVAITYHTPDHNLQEVVEALKIVLKKCDNVKMKDLMKVFHGPDGTSGGKLLTPVDELIKIYETGEGKMTYECDYEITQVGKKSYILNVTGYCPTFKPSTFQAAMIKLMDERVDGDRMVQYANDASTKENPCNFEVMFVGEDTFEKEIHKHLIKNYAVQYYALDRRRSANPEIRDIDTKLLKLGLIDYMKIWLDWRREVEAKLLKVERADTELKYFKTMCRIDAAKHLDVIKKALEADETEDYIAKNLPLFKKTKDPQKVKEGAEYITDLKLSALKKVDIEKLEKDSKDLIKEMERIDADLLDIDRVISRKLDGLKPFFKPRSLKIS